ncbi:MAG: hypothetical protein KatS3mg097_301 [Candidatus Parcubacteria bacterium]|nr:MAG: hypothetical protein KatS3mg097_301 [Candidatus Parcubacteria bacterium]
MLKKQFRLDGKTIKNLFAGKLKKISNGNFTILYTPNNLKHCRFTVICKKENFKKATLRNKIKRQIYSLLFRLIKNNFFKQNYDCIIIINQTINDYQSLINLLEKIF